MRSTLAILTSLVIAPACTTSDPHPQDIDKILLVTLEATRADRLGPYGYPGSHTPTLDELAADGTTWMRAYSASPQTVPSLATLFTGRYPPAHGVHHATEEQLPESEQTLAEVLSGAGWETLAFPSGLTTHRRWGLDQGFDVYEDRLTERPGTPQWRTQTRADRVIDDVVRTLDRVDDDSSAFVWVHLYDAHWPLDAPRPWPEGVEDPYDAEVAYADGELGRLVDWWDHRWGRERSWVVVTASQGSDLEHEGEQGSGFLLDDATLHVPLILRGPGIRQDRDDDDLVSQVDILPTLLRAVDLPVPDGVSGRDLELGGSDWAYHQNLEGQARLGLAPMRALTDDNGRVTEGAWPSWSPALGLWLPSEGERLDPDDRKVARLHEVTASLGSELAPAITLEPQLLRMLSALGEPASGDPGAAKGPLDPRDVIDALPLAQRIERRMWGGLQRQALERLDELKQRLPGSYAAELLEARIAQRQGRIEDARRVFERLFHRHPTPTVAVQLAGLCDATGNPWAAATWYDEALRLDPQSPEALAGRVRATWAAGLDDEADTLVTRMQWLHTDHPELAIIEAEQLLRQGQPQQAMDLAFEGLQSRPWSAWARSTIGAAHWELGQPQQAIETLQQAVALDPYSAALRLRLADFLLEVGRNSEAVRAMAPLAQVAPDDESIQGVYQAARMSLTMDERHDIRVRRALGPTGLGY